MLQKGRKMTLEGLIEACNRALYFANGYGDVSRRTIQHDIEEMRYSETLGYHAPIKVVDRKYYMYANHNYSITQIPLSTEDMLQLSEAVDLLKQMSSFKGFNGVEDVVNRLEDHVASMRYKVEPVILLENNERLRGLEYISVLHDAINQKQAINITYKLFRSSEAQTFCFSPYLLKEFRNRWFVFGKRHDFKTPLISNLALDRIEHITNAPKEELYIKENGFKPKQYFQDMIGVSRNIDSYVEHIIFVAAESDAPYLRTKPLHQSQKEIETLADGSVLFSIDVILNHELEHDILGYGEGITIISPASLVKKLQNRLTRSLENYEKTKNG